MDNHSLLDILFELPSSDFLLEREAMETNMLKPWSRPTQGWSLECEAEGRTKAKAFEKTLLTVEITGHELHIGNCGIAILVLLPMIFCCTCCCCICQSKAGADEGAATIALVNLACTHLIWIVIGSIIMSSTAKVLEASEAAQDIAFEFNAINECGDVENFVD